MEKFQGSGWRRAGPVLDVGRRPHLVEVRRERGRGCTGARGRTGRAAAGTPREPDAGGPFARRADARPRARADRRARPESAAGRIARTGCAQRRAGVTWAGRRFGTSRDHRRESTGRRAQVRVRRRGRRAWTRPWRGRPGDADRERADLFRAGGYHEDDHHRRLLGAHGGHQAHRQPPCGVLLRGAGAHPPRRAFGEAADARPSGQGEP